MITLDGVRISIGNSWGLIRPSNTEPKLSMRFEADSPEELESIKLEFTRALQKYFDLETLNHYL